MKAAVSRGFLLFRRPGRGRLWCYFWCYGARRAAPRQLSTRDCRSSAPAGARLVWRNVSGTELTQARHRRLTVPLTDIIQTTAATLDLLDGDLVEVSTYYPNGARETLLIDEDDPSATEPSGFTGKEGDEEVGVTYFGERYLVARIGRWASPDPLHVHASGGGEALNAYHYISGNLLQVRDALGLEGEPVPGAAQVAADGTTIRETNAGVVAAEAELPESIGGGLVQVRTGVELTIDYPGSGADRTQRYDVAIGVSGGPAAHAHFVQIYDEDAVVVLSGGLLDPWADERVREEPTHRDSPVVFERDGDIWALDDGTAVGYAQSGGARLFPGERYGEIIYDAPRWIGADNILENDASVDRVTFETYLFRGSGDVASLQSIARVTWQVRQDICRGPEGITVTRSVSVLGIEEVGVDSFPAEARAAIQSTFSPQDREMRNMY